MFFCLGAGANIDFGNKWSTTDSELTVNFTLSVTHELKLTTTADDQSASLQPCTSVCQARGGQSISNVSSRVAQTVPSEAIRSPHRWFPSRRF